MPTKARASKIDKYSSSPHQEFMTHKGRKVPLGGVAKMLSTVIRFGTPISNAWSTTPKRKTPLSGTKALTFGKDSRIAATSA